jgi:hypothetical protein
MTADATDELHPNAVHPDQHFLVTVPGDPYQFIESGDGGVVRASGRFTDVSVWCDHRGLTGAALTRCKQLLSRVPKRIESMNNGLRTLQFQSLAVSPHDVNKLMGGTQDNGTWENRGPVLWENIMIGDGGQSGFDVGIPEFRFQNLFNANPSVNFDSGDMSKWIYIGAGLAGGLPEFYIPMISDPAVSKTLFAGGGLTAYRTKTAGLGTRTYADAVVTCNFWTGTVACGDWARLGPTTLTNVALGDRAGGAMAAIERTKADTSTAWAATTTGRVFVSKNVDAEPVAVVAGQRVATSVSWTRIDDDAITPGRFVSGIHVDPANGNHAWVSYSGFDANTPATPGHVFEVTFNPATNSATWVDRSYDWGDLPATDIVADSNGDLYASSDFGVSRLVSGTTSWTLAGTGMPNVEVAGLTIVPEARRLYAASHGLGAWQLKLP